MSHYKHYKCVTGVLQATCVLRTTSILRLAPMSLLNSARSALESYTRLICDVTECYCGLKHCQYDVTDVTDCDLPQILPLLMSAARPCHQLSCIGVQECGCDGTERE